MVFNLNIVDLTIAFTYKIYCSIKLSTILLRTKFIRQELQN